MSFIYIEIIEKKRAFFFFSPSFDIHNIIDLQNGLKVSEKHTQEKKISQKSPKIF